MALLRLNRPDTRNAIDRQMAQELSAALDALAQDDPVHVLVVTGAGDKAFCAGADMAEAVAQPDLGPLIANTLIKVLRFPKPVIAAVNGYAYGAGALLAIYCDIRLASHNVRFRFPGAEYGLVTGAAYLPRLVGLSRAKEIIYTARPVDCQEALSMGLVNRVLPQEELLAGALSLATQMAAHSLPALKAAKQILDLSLGTWEPLHQEGEVNQTLRQQDDYRRRFQEAAYRITGHT